MKDLSRVLYFGVLLPFLMVTCMVCNFLFCLTACSHSRPPLAQARPLVVAPATRAHTPSQGPRNDGKPLAEFEPTDPIYFQFDSYALKEPEKAFVLAAYLVQKGKSVRLDGYASPEGSDEYNLALGARRAAAVKQYLNAAGVPWERITCQSFGEEKPVTENSAEYWRDRRVEISIEGVSP